MVGANVGVVSVLLVYPRLVFKLRIVAVGVVCLFGKACNETTTGRK